MGAQRALGRGRRSPDALDAALVGLVDRLSRRLRAARRVCRTVVLRIRFDDFSRASRSHTLPHATANTESILVTARGLLAGALPMIECRGITLVGIAVTSLEDGRLVQLALPLDRHASDALDAVVDEVRARFGASAITRAVLLGRRHGPAVPLLAD
jgi:DNA polymerase-4